MRTKRELVTTMASVGKKWKLFKKTLNDFLLSHEKIHLNSNVGAFNSYF